MKYAIVRHGEFVGTLYNELNDNIINFHTNEGNIIIPVESREQLESILEAPTNLYDSVMEVMKHDKKNEIANTRYNAEIKGVQYGNMFIKTDRESRLAFIELYNRAKEDVNYSCSFKAINGWFNITAEDIIVINDLIRQYVQDCFDVENYLMQQVEQATTIEELENIDVENAFSN